MTKTDIFNEERFARTRLPILKADTLPPTCYSSAEWYEREVEKIFFKEWLCVGRVEQIPSYGDYFTIDIVDEPLVIVRLEDGSIAAHSAVCRHRGAVVVTGEGNSRSFRCPYHSWTYGLDGQLLGTPGRPRPMDDVENFDKSAYGLVSIRADTWGGFIMINFDPKAPPLTTWLGGLPELLKNYKLEDLRCTLRTPYQVGCNWKVYMENAHEEYHSETVHKKHIKPNDERTIEYEDSVGPYEAVYMRGSFVQYSELPIVSSLTEKERSGMYYMWVHPTLQLILAPTYVKYRLYFPRGPENFTLVNHWCFPATTIVRPDFERLVGPGYYKKYDEIIDEDVSICPTVQRGQRSRLARSGRFSPREEVVHRLANYIIDRVIGPPHKNGKAARNA